MTEELQARIVSAAPEEMLDVAIQLRTPDAVTAAGQHVIRVGGFVVHSASTLLICTIPSVQLLKLAGRNDVKHIMLTPHPFGAEPKRITYGRVKPRMSAARMDKLARFFGYWAIAASFLMLISVLFFEGRTLGVALALLTVTCLASIVFTALAAHYEGNDPTPEEDE